MRKESSAFPALSFFVGSEVSHIERGERKRWIDRISSDFLKTFRDEVTVLLANRFRYAGIAGLGKLSL